MGQSSASAGSEVVDSTQQGDDVSCIALLLGGGKDQQLLASHFSEYYTVVQPDVDNFDETEFDLCIVDTKRFQMHQSLLKAEKRAAEPLILPYLLVSRRELDDLPRDIWSHVDDVITAPIEFAELSPRIESLLRLRRLSLRVRQQRRLEEVASVISHDLRSPLQVVQGNLELAKETGNSKYFNVAESSLERANDLISDVLTLARQGSADADIAPVSLSDVVRNVWMTTETGDSELDLSLDEDYVLYADEGQLKQLLANLIDNANGHNTGSVTIGVGEFSNGFYVEDDGDGLPKHIGMKVLDTGVSTSESGTGLGLSIVQRIVDAHGWTLSVDESDAGGVRFKFSDIVLPPTRDDV